MKIHRLLLTAVIAIQAAAAQAQTPPPPAEAPDEWLLAFVDVETTGLIPGYHEMIDIGIVMTNFDGTEKDSLFIRIQPEHPERTDDSARAVNAFDTSRWKQLGALPLSDAVDRIVSFHEKTAGDKTVLMVAFNSHFDAAFLDHFFRARKRNWRDLYHYVILDLPSMAWGQGHRVLNGSSLAEALGVEDEPRIARQHTGITGAKLNARIYRALIR